MTRTFSQVRQRVFLTVQLVTFIRVLYNGSNETSYSHEKWVRLESKWQYVDPEKIRIYTLGDFISNSPDWGSSVRLLVFSGRVLIVNAVILSPQHSRNFPVRQHCLQHWIYMSINKRFIQG